MYVPPQRYKCDRCGDEGYYSPHDDATSLHINGEPVCNYCLSEFILAHCGVMRSTVDFGKGSEYDRAKERQT